MLELFNTLRKDLLFAAAGSAAAMLLLFYGGGVGLEIAEGLVIALVLAAFVFRSGARSLSAANTVATDRAELAPLAREVLEGLPDPLLLVESSGRVTLANKAMRAPVFED